MTFAELPSFLATSNITPCTAQTCHIVITRVQLALRSEFAEAWSHLAPKPSSPTTTEKKQTNQKTGEPPNLTCAAVYYNTCRSPIPVLISCTLVLLFLILSWYISHHQPSHKRLTVCLLKPLTIHDYAALMVHGSDVWPQWRPSKTQTILMLHASLLVSSTTAKKKDSLSGHSDALLHSSSLTVWNHGVSAGLITAASALVAAVSWAPQWQMGAAADQRLSTKTLLFTSCTRVTSLSFWWNTKHKLADFSKALKNISMKFLPTKYLWKNQTRSGFGYWHVASQQ